MPSAANATSQPDEHERRARPCVVSPGEPDVEPSECRGRVVVARDRIGGVAPAAIAFAVGAMSASETSPSMRVDPDVSSPRYPGPTIATG